MILAIFTHELQARRFSGMDTIKRQTGAAYGWLVVGRSVDAVFIYTAYRLCARFVYEIKAPLNKRYMHIFYSPKTAANTKATKEKAEHVQIARE